MTFPMTIKERLTGVELALNRLNERFEAHLEEPDKPGELISWANEEIKRCRSVVEEVNNKL